MLLFFGLGYLCQVELDAGNELGREAVTVRVVGIQLDPFCSLGEDAQRFAATTCAATLAALSASGPATAGSPPEPGSQSGLPPIAQLTQGHS